MAIFHGTARRPIVAELQAAGKRVFPWTVNSAAHIKAVLDAGVDGVVTNMPRLTLHAVQHRLARCLRHDFDEGPADA